MSTDLLALARAALGRTDEGEVAHAGGSFTADFFCEVRWPEDATHKDGRPFDRAGHYHGRFSAIIPRVDRGKGLPCPICGTHSAEVPGAPRVSNASYPDGSRRDLTDQKKAADLEVEAIDYAWDAPERKEIETEIYERTKVKT